MKDNGEHRLCCAWVFCFLVRFRSLKVKTNMKSVTAMTVRDQFRKLFIVFQPTSVKWTLTWSGLRCLLGQKNPSLSCAVFLLYRPPPVLSAAVPRNRPSPLWSVSRSLLLLLASVEDSCSLSRSDALPMLKENVETVIVCSTCDVQLEAKSKNFFLPTLKLPLFKLSVLATSAFFQTSARGLALCFTWQF